MLRTIFKIVEHPPFQGSSLERRILKNTKHSADYGWLVASKGQSVALVSRA